MVAGSAHPANVYLPLLAKGREHYSRLVLDRQSSHLRLRAAPDIFVVWHSTMHTPTVIPPSDKTVIITRAAFLSFCLTVLFSTIGHRLGMKLSFDLTALVWIVHLERLNNFRSAFRMNKAGKNTSLYSTLFGVRCHVASLSVFRASGGWTKKFYSLQ